MRIVKLDINPEIDLAGVDAVALVENPAIEEDFMYFSKYEEDEFAETYTDYPEGAVEAAKMGIKRNKEIDNKCATQVGKVRAQQLANREPISLDTVRRMRSFLVRQKGNFELAQERKDYNACGYISYLLWGGPEALPWAEKVLRQAEGEEFAESGGGFRVGDYVSWTYAGRTEDADRGRGQIKDIRVQGEVQIPDSDFVFKPTEDRPLALIETRSGKIVGQYTDNLRKIQKPEDFKKAIIEGIIGLEIGKVKDMEYAITDEVGDYTGVFSQNKTIYLVSCSSQKLNKPAKAKELYMSPLFEKSLNYCYSKGATDKDIKILSGKYGLVDMNTVIKPYDVYLGDKSAEQKKAWAEDVFKVLERRYDLETTKFVFLAGTDYTQYLEDMLPKSKDVLEGKKQGERLQYLDKFAALDEQQMLVGPLMKPNQLIKRLDEAGEYYVYFTEDTIKKIAYKLMEDKLIDRVNLEHNGKDVVDAIMVETWIVEDPNRDKALSYGYQPKKGEWYGMYKIKDKKIWDDYVKTGLVKGFSVEGIFQKFAAAHCVTGKPCMCGKSESGMCDGSHLK